MNKHPGMLCLSFVAVLLSACSFSESSKSSAGSSGSVSDLASSPFVSSSRSLETEREGYEREVADYTAEYVKSSSGDMEAFRVRMGKLAQSHGITNWEEDKSTYFAIGRGLRKADLSKPQYVALKSTLADSQAQRMNYIEQGYKK